MNDSVAQSADQITDPEKPGRVLSAVLQVPLAATSQPVRPLTGDDCRGSKEAGRSLTPSWQGHPGFEIFLAELSTTFVNVSGSQVDSHIELALQRLVEFLNIDRSGFAELSPDGKRFVVTHSYQLPAVSMCPLGNVEANFPWYAKTILQGEVFRLPDDLPPEAIQEREYCAQVGLKSNVTIPLKVEGTVVGGIGFASYRSHCNWPDELIRRLRLVGEIFANAMARKRAEENTQRLRDHLARVARVTTMGELAAAIAHEINQPLCAIVSNAQAAQRLLAGGSADVQEAREALQDIATDGRRAAEVIARIRTLLEGRQPERAPFNLNEAIGEVAALLHHQLTRKGVSFRRALTAGLPPVHGDRVQLQQVVLNLIVNAIDALGHCEGRSREVVVESARSAGDMVLVSVKDSGPGIRSDDAERIFEAFFSTKAGGMGIGLAVCRSIVEAHGGRIWTEPNAGPGATFHFTVPAAQEPRQ
jgi:signal transduction histidine kinase